MLDACERPSHQFAPSKGWSVCDDQGWHRATSRSARQNVGGHAHHTIGYRPRRILLAQLWVLGPQARQTGGDHRNLIIKLSGFTVHALPLTIRLTLWASVSLKFKSCSPYNIANVTCAPQADSTRSAQNCTKSDGNGCHTKTELLLSWAQNDRHQKRKKVIHGRSHTGRCPARRTLVRPLVVKTILAPTIGGINGQLLHR